MSSRLPPKPRGRADAGQLDVADELAVQRRSTFTCGLGVLQVAADEPVADEVDAVERLLRLAG